MTDPELAHRTYIEPLTKEYLEEIISREKPDALLPTVGGQTALNLAVELPKAHPRKMQSGDDRARCAPSRWRKIACGSRTPAERLVWKCQPPPGEQREGRIAALRSIGISAGDSAVIHARRNGRLDRLQQGEFGEASRTL